MTVELLLLCKSSFYTLVFIVGLAEYRCITWACWLLQQCMTLVYALNY